MVRTGKNRARVLLGILAGVWWLGCPGAWGAARPTVFVPVPGLEIGTGPREWAVDGEVLVRFRPEAARRPAGLDGQFGGRLRWLSRRSRAALAGIGNDAATVLDSMAVVRLPAGQSLEAGIAEIGRRPDVLYAEPNLRLGVTLRESPPDPVPTPSDFGFGRQWGLENSGQTGGSPGADIGARRAWAVTTGSSNVVVAIIDTGVDYFHPDLEPNIWTNPREIAGNGVDDDGNGYIDDVHGYDWVSDDSDPMDDNLHGTHVAGILGAAGNDETGVAGVAWSVRMMALKAFDETGAGSLDDTLVAVDYARKAGARVINASWGTTVRSRALDEVSADAVAAGVVFVGAAGNNGTDARFFPAAVPQVIAVSASDAKDASPTFANYGTFVDLVAPGDAIYSTAPNAAWTVLNGTSMAAPHVSGLVALQLAAHPAFTPAEIRAILLSTADELTTDRFTGAGRINAARAMAVREPLPSARLEAPATWSGRIAARGEAAGHRFAGFRLELGAGERPASWELLSAGSQGVADGGLLVDLDSARFDDGDYVLRLTVTNGLGQAAVERMPVAIRNVRLQAPANNDVLRGGDRIEIRGTVHGDGRTFELQWGLGHAPREWSSRGVDLVDGGSRPVVDGLLARWDTTAAPPGAFVTLRLTARSGDRAVGEAWARMVHLEPRLREGWPRRFPFTDEFPVANWREFTLADLEGDGADEVVWVDHGEPGGRVPRLVVLNARGETVWSRELAPGAPEYDAPVVGDVDGDGRAEVFVDTGTGGRIAAFDAGGQPLPGAWPATPGGSHFAKILADLEADGRQELIVLSHPPSDLVGGRQRELSVLNANGGMLAHWTFSGCDSATNRLEQMPAVIQLDDDEPLEIVAVDGCLGVSAFDLAVKEGPVWTAMTDANLYASPVVADLDGDGTEEVIVGGVRRDVGLPGGLHVIRRDGLPRSGFPVLPQESLGLPVALGDLNGDGRFEMVVAGSDSDTIHVVQADGFELPGWPLAAQSQSVPESAPLLADVDGDGAADVVMACPGNWLVVVLAGQTARAGGVRAWRADGSEIDFQPGQDTTALAMESSTGGSWVRFPPLALGDLDGNGRLDVVAATIQDRTYSPTPPVSGSKLRSTLYAWELPVPSAGTTAFSKYQGGAGRPGRLARPKAVNQAPRLLPLPRQTIAPGGEFRVLPLDRYVQDPDHRVDQLTWQVSGPPGGRLAASLEPGNRLVVRVADGSWTGRESFEFRVRDPAGGEARGSTTFEVRPGFIPPSARTDDGVVVEDGTLLLDPLANDASPSGRPLRVVGVSRPGSGQTRLLPDGRVAYSPATNFFGTDRFEYTLEDDDGGSATGEAVVTVTGTPDAPEALADKLILDEDAIGEFAVLENDVEPDGEGMEVTEIEAPKEGRLEALGAGRYRYVPTPDFSGQEILAYRVRDPGGLMATGQVSILVKPVNDLPVVRDQVVTLNRNRAADVIYDAKDADGDRLTFQIVQGPTNGVLLVYPELANFAPRAGFSGRDQFTYTATDGRVTVGPATVTLQVVATNNPPDIEPERRVTAVDQALSVGLRVRDVDGDAFRVLLDQAPKHGRVELSGTNAVYWPETGFEGDDAFYVAGQDAQATGPRAEMLVRVTSENTAPIPEPQVREVPRNRSTPITLEARDAENNPLRFQVVTNPAYGRIDGDAPRLVYTPLPNFRGLDRVLYTVSDGKLTSLVATEHLLVRDPNQVPQTTNQTVLVRRDGTRGFRLAATDADGHLLRAVVLKGPKQGRVAGGGLDYRYTPRLGYEGLDTFTYKVWDGFGYSNESTVTLRVEAQLVPQVRIVAVRLLSEGVEVELNTRSARSLRLEASVDLREWTSVGTWDAPGSDVRWVDVTAGGREQRFFRAVVEGFEGAEFE